MVEALKERNEELFDKNSKQTIVGISADSFDPLSTRMVDLLGEAGLLYRDREEVSHGPDRQYQRFVPHLAALIAARAFTGGGKGTSPSKIVDFIERPSEKHPLRRTIKSIFVKQKIEENLKLDLPPCKACGTTRENEKQKFCQNCGNRLVDELIYTRIMGMQISLVPGVPLSLAKRVQGGNIHTIGDLRALRDPGTELRKILGIGKVKSNKVLTGVEAHIDEMMS